MKFRWTSIHEIDIDPNDLIENYNYYKSVGFSDASIELSVDDCLRMETKWYTEVSNTLDNTRKEMEEYLKSLV